MNRLLLTIIIVLVPALPARAGEDGWELFRKRDYAAALACFESQLNQYREWAALRDGMGWCHYFLGEHEEAEQRFREALEIDPEYKWSLEGLEALEATRARPLEQADALLNAGQYPEARSAYRRIIEGQTLAGAEALGSAERGEGWCLYYLGRYPEAIKSFRKARKRDDEDAGALRGIGYSEYAQGEHRRALTSLQLSLEVDPNDYVARLTAGWCHYYRGDHSAATEQFEQAAASLVGAWGAYSGIGWCRLGQGDEPGALAAFSEALAISPYALTAELAARIEIAPAWRTLHNVTGWSALRADLSAWALAEFQTSAALGCETAQALSGQAFALLRMGRNEEAAAAAEAALAAGAIDAERTFPVVLSDGSTAEVAMNLASLQGWVAQRRGLYEDAARRFASVRRDHPNWADAACGEGWAHYAQGNYPAAERAFDEALTALPGYSDAEAGAAAVAAWRYADYDKAWALYFAGDWDGARAALDEIAGDPRSPFPRTRLDLVEASRGWVAWRAGDAREAREAFERALELSPGLGLAERGWGTMLLEQGQWALAARHLRKAVEDPRLAADAEVWTALGRALLAEREFTQAGEAFERAVALGPWQAATHFGQALYLLATLEDVEARLAFERAISLDASVGLDPTLVSLMEKRRELVKLHSPLGWAWLYRGALELAEAQFRLAREHDPLESSALCGLGLCLLRAGRVDEGEEALLDWLDDAPKSENPWGGWSSVLSELGWTLYGAGEYDRAIKAFRRLESLHKGQLEQYADPFAGQGWSALQLGSERDAKKAFLSGVAIDPRHESSLTGLEALAERD